MHTHTHKYSHACLHTPKTPFYTVNNVILGMIGKQHHPSVYEYQSTYPLYMEYVLHTV